jgi:hypothetical protein
MGPTARRGAVPRIPLGRICLRHEPRSLRNLCVIRIQCAARRRDASRSSIADSHV